MQPPDQDRRVYSFDGNLAFSEGVSESSQVTEILLKNLPGARQVFPACKENDRSGTDYWVEMISGNMLSVDTKVRREDYALRGQDDLALETWSVCEANKVGWTRDEAKRTDYVLWLWVETGRWCLISFPQLCAVMCAKWQEWYQVHKHREQRTERAGRSAYTSECLFVPRREVWVEIYKRFSGAPVA